MSLSRFTIVKQLYYIILPVVSLVTSESRAVYPRLLSSPDTDDLSVPGVANRVALGVLDGDRGHYEIPEGAFRQVLAFADEVRESRVVDFGVVAALLQSHAVQDLALQGCGLVLGVDLQDAVGAVLLFSQKRESLLGVARGDYTVRNFSERVKLKL